MQYRNLHHLIKDITSYLVIQLMFFLFPVLSYAQPFDPQHTIFLSVPGDVRLNNKKELQQQINSMDSTCVEHISIAVYEQSYQYQNNKNVYPEFFCVYDTYLQNLGELYELIPWKKWTRVNEVTLPFADSISPNYLKNIRRYFTLNWTFGIIYPYTANYETLPIKDLQIGRPAFAALSTESLNKIPSRLQRFSIPTINGVTEIADLNYIGIDLDNWNRLTQSEFNLTPIRLGNFENVQVTLNASTFLSNELNLNFFTSAKNLSINSGNFSHPPTGVSFELQELKQLKRLTINGEFWYSPVDRKTKGNTLSAPNLEVLVISNYKREQQRFEGSLNNFVFTAPKAPTTFWDPLFISSVTDIRCPALKYLNLKSNYLFPTIDQCTQLEKLVLNTSNMTLNTSFGDLRNLKEFHLIAIDSNAKIAISDTFAFPYLTHFTFEQQFPLVKASMSNDTTERLSATHIHIPFLVGAPLKKVLFRTFDRNVWETVLSLQQLDTLELSSECVAQITRQQLWESLLRLKSLGALTLHASANNTQPLPTREQLRAVLSKETDIVLIEACQ